jgi:hypothetical protein
MLERETEIIITIITERTIGSARSLALRDVLAADVPKAVTQYLQCEIARLMQDDLANANRFSNFKFASPLVHQLTRSYTRTLAPEYIFSREEFASMLDNAVHFVENYLCRPQWTLEHFVFENSEHATSLELRNRLDYLSEYLYYPKLIDGFMRQKGWQEIGVGDFRSLLTKIDDQIVKQHDAQELAQLTRPIYEFFLLQKDITGKPIPVKPLLVFFEDKKLKLVKEYVERICHIRKSEHLTIEQLAIIIDDVYGGVGSPAKKSAAKEERLVEENMEQVARPEQKSGALPSEVSSREANTLPTPLEDLRRSNTAASGSERRNVALSLTFSGMTDSSHSPVTPSLLADLKTAIDAAQRERFIRTIFRKDESYYNIVIESLNDMTTWNDASLYLQTFYQTSGLDPDLADVVEFTDLIHLRYSLTQKK